MSFYIRKYARVGPLRLNFSKSGVGVSAGVKGLRIGTGPRGNYVHMGRNGLYYRQSLNSLTQQQPGQQLTHDPIPQATQMQTIDSQAAETLVDASANALLEEIRAKNRYRYLSPFALAFSIVGLFVLYLMHIPIYIQIGWIVITFAGTVLLFYRDELKKSVVIVYQLENESETAYQNLHQAFKGLMECNGLWHIPATGSVQDTKYHAGANTLMERQPIKDKAADLPLIKSNVEFPVLSAGKQKLAFTPERVLVFENENVGAVSYTDLGIDVKFSKFVEEEPPPPDGKVIEQTWKYLNKKGGPDKRFKDNRELPVMLYEEIHFTSSSGLNELFMASKLGVGSPIKAAVIELTNLLKASSNN